MIFVDTTPLVALCDARDRNHRRALAELDRVSRRGLVLCEPVLTQACFLLASPWLRARLAGLLTDLRVRAWSPPDLDEFRRTVFEWLARYAEHEPDWADGVLAVASDLERKARVWTYDSEFRTTWRRPGGSHIPLVVRS